MPDKPYVPNPVASVKSLADLLAYLTREQEKIRTALSEGAPSVYTELHAEPKKPPGKVVVAFADGTDWDPGHGKGLYAWYNSTWNPMFRPPDDPPLVSDADDPPEQARPEEPIFLHSFETSPLENGHYTLQAASPNRATLVSPGRIGNKSVRLLTSGSDTGIRCPNNVERCDMVLTVQKSDGFPDHEAWWAFSIMFPDDFQMGVPGQTDPGFWYVTWQWHSEPTSGLGPMHQLVVTTNNPPGPHLAWLVGGNTSRRRTYVIDGGAFPTRNVWYDFVQHVTWKTVPTPASTEVWMRKGNAAQYDKIFTDNGANLYPDFPRAYLKVGSYHSNIGVPSAVMYDRIAFGKTPHSVAMAPLAGVP